MPRGGCCVPDRAARTRLYACYPLDGRNSPNYARVVELISWSTHNINNFAPIPGILQEQIQTDFMQQSANRVSVGCAIFVSLLEKVREANLSLSRALTSIITSLIQSNNRTFLEIAADNTSSLIKFTHEQYKGQPIRDIVTVLIPLCNDPDLKEFAFARIAAITEEASIDWLPFDSLFVAIYQDLPSGVGVLTSISKHLYPMITTRFSQLLFTFFEHEGLWNDSSIVFNIMKIIFQGVTSQVAPSLFQLFLEQLPPIGHNQCPQVILEVAIRLLETFQDQKLASQTRIVAFNTLVLFMFTISNDEALFEMACTLERLFLLALKQELIKEAFTQLWILFPTSSDPSPSYDERKVRIIIRAADTFVNAVGVRVTCGMLNESLNHVYSFLIRYTHSNEIYADLLVYLKNITTIVPKSKVDCVVPFLASVQNDAHSIQIHTFVLCAFNDVAEDAPHEFQKHFKGVCKSRIKAHPPQIDYTMQIAKDRFSRVRKLSGDIATEVTEFVKINKLLKGSRSSGMFTPKSIDINPSNEEEDIDTSPLLAQRNAQQNWNQSDTETSAIEAFEDFDVAIDSYRNLSGQKAQTLEMIQAVPFEMNGGLVEDA